MVFMVIFSSSVILISHRSSDTKAHDNSCFTGYHSISLLRLCVYIFINFTLKYVINKCQLFLRLRQMDSAWSKMPLVSIHLPSHTFA